MADAQEQAAQAHAAQQAQQINYNREMLSFDEKIALAELEESKAAERVKELKYQKHRFMLDIFMAGLKAKEGQNAAGTQ